jgi:hypothetical protein
LIGFALLSSCGKPKDPETIEPVTEPDGGYKIVAKLSTSGSAQDVIKRGDMLYMAQGEGGLLIVDVSNPENPTVVNEITEGVRGYSAKIDFRDDIVYLAAGSYGISVVDVSNPMAPDVNGWYVNLVKPAKNLHILGDFLFTAISEKGIQLVYVKKNLSLPATRTDIITEGYANGLTTSPDSSTMFVACGEMGLSIYDISDFQDGYGVYPRLGWCDTPGYAETVIVEDNQSLAFLACGTEGLHIIDYADTANIYRIGNFATEGYAKELLYENQKIFITTGLRGLQIIDVANAAEPKIIGVVPTGNARGFDMDEDHIYIADEVEGLIVISRPD